MQRRSEELHSIFAEVESALNDPNLDDSDTTVDRVFSFLRATCNEARRQLLLPGDRADGGDGTTAPRTAPRTTDEDGETPNLVQELPPTDPAMTEKAETGPRDASQQTAEQLGSLPAPVEKTLEGPQSRSRPRAKPIQCNVGFEDACQMLLGRPLKLRALASRERIQEVAPNEWKEAVDLYYDLETKIWDNGPEDDVERLSNCVIVAAQVWRDQGGVQVFPEEVKSWLRVLARTINDHRGREAEAGGDTLGRAVAGIESCLRDNR